MKKRKFLKLGYQTFCNIKLQFFIGFMFVAALGFSLSYCGEKLIGDDYWWHVKVGEWICENQETPKIGIFSWYAMQKNLEWFAHEWLSEVILYVFQVLFGEYSCILYILLCVVFILIMLYIFQWHLFLQNYLFFIFWAFAGMYYLGMVATARPHLLGLCFFALYLFLLELIEKNAKKNLYYITPILSCFWANCHGGSVNLVYILPILYLLAGCKKNFFLKLKIENYSWKQIKAYLYCIITGILGIGINPRGFQLLLYPYTYSNDSTKYIQEWKAPNFKDNISIFIWIIFICLIWILTEKKIKRKDLLVTGAFLILTLISVRFIAWLFIVSSVLVIPYIKKIPKLRKYDSVHLFICVFSIVLLIALPLQKIEREIKTEMVLLIREENYKNMYNSYALGDCLIYEDIDVFFDGRADLYYPDGSLEDGFQLNFKDSSDKKKKGIIEKYGFDFFVTEEDSGLNEFLKRHKKKYQLLYKDGRYVIYKKNE